MAKKEILLPFDLEKAKAGAKLRLTNGENARIVCYDVKSKSNKDYCILVLCDNGVNEYVQHFKADGTCFGVGLNLQIVKEIEVPDRWRDKNKEVTECFVRADESIVTRNTTFEKIVAPTSRKEARSERAFDKICHIIKYDKRFGGVITNEEWGNENIAKAVIVRSRNSILAVEYSRTWALLAFHTEEQRDLFLKENEDLVKQYFML